ncbi:MAG TPA: 4a-hydroxytetrahydrobiopterin dehydratase [Planctomycetota bacterium]|nr:4a-hydroxytetrahydrobiopterin dehydratase [Planctomycetota bacterium]
MSPARKARRIPKRPRRLSAAELRAALVRLPNWRLDGGRLYREWTFPDFATAFSFMTKVALVAEAMGHHPDWSNSYRMVRIWLTTHDAGGITIKDIALAESIGA